MAALAAPIGSRGGCSFVHENCFYLYGGYKSGQNPRVPRVDSDLWCLDLQSCSWSVKACSVEKPSASKPSSLAQALRKKVLTGASCAVTGGRLYVFGGWSVGMRNAEVWELELSSGTWRELQPVEAEEAEGPLCKDKAGMVAYGEEMLCVFGGYGYPNRYRLQRGASYNWDQQYLDVCWTNELHLFHVGQRLWLSPEVTGPRPPPCAAFSFTQVDCCRVALFGGRQQRQRVNELYILNMEDWHWSGVCMPLLPSTPWPSLRSFHTACSLVDPSCLAPPPQVQRSHGATHTPPISAAPRCELPWLPCPRPDLCCPSPLPVSPKLLVLWGMDNEANPVSDAWILDVDALSWRKVDLPAGAGLARLWHTMAPCYLSSCEVELTVFGGAAENLFVQEEILCPNVDDTLVLHFGVRSLQHLCVGAVVKHKEHLSSLLPSLPLPLQRLVELFQLRTKALNYLEL